jgi:membrane-bound lytic murein transglycosylase B
MIARLFPLLLLLSFARSGFAAELPGIPQFIDEMVSKYQFKRENLEDIFKRAERKQSIIDAITAPATLKPWADYRTVFINPQRVNNGLQFWGQYHDALERAEKQYGVPQEIIVALIGVETNYGRNVGKYLVLDALTTLSFDYPKRSDFFRGELAQYLLLTREQNFDIFKLQGSYAGAIGIPQFMPSSYRKYAVDFDNDGKTDILQDPVDAIGSVANYLKQYGWIEGEPITARASVSEDDCVGSLSEGRTLTEWASAGIKPVTPFVTGKALRLVDFTVPEGKEFWLAANNFDVITRYNNSDFYAMSVFQLAQALLDARH